jgi:hypothetical protein
MLRDVRLEICAFVAALGVACGATRNEHVSVDEAGGAGGGTIAVSGAGGVSLRTEPRAGGGGIEECAAISQRAGSARPVDITFVIDNSGSMTEEIAAVEDRINADFAKIIEESGVDYRVIMVARFGKHPQNSGEAGAQDLCIRAPLGPNDCSGTSKLAHRPPRFFHYDSEVMSTDAWCKLLDGFRSPQYLASSGWSEFARPEAFKSFVIISDDDNGCVTHLATERSPTPEALIDDVEAFVFKDPATNAKRFDEALTRLSTNQFGTRERRNYRVHSIIGAVGNPAGDGTWSAADPIQSDVCPTAVAAGVNHQALSVLTGGLRYPICNHGNFDVVFHALAEDAIRASRLACEWALPPPPVGQSFDSGLVNLDYKPGNGTGTHTIPKVAKEAQCGTSGGWYYDEDTHPTKIIACPTTCDVLEADQKGEISIALGCATIVDVR